VTSSIEIAALPRDVWEVVMNPRRLGDWVTIHRRLDESSDGPPREGFEMHQTLHMRGANFKVNWTLVECDAPRLAVWEGRGPARSRARTEYRLSEHDGGTRFDYRNEFHAPLGPLGAAASRTLMGGMPEREANRTLSRLKQLIESD
jgi:carbon monoxide dehydrogenase subunit G